MSKLVIEYIVSSLHSSKSSCRNLRSTRPELFKFNSFRTRKLLMIKPAVDAEAKSHLLRLREETVFSAWYIKSVVNIRRNIGSKELETFLKSIDRQ